MVEDTKKLFQEIMTTFLNKYEFYFPEIFNEEELTEEEWRKKTNKH